MEKFGIDYAAANAQGTLIYPAIHGQYSGALVICDEIQANAAQAVTALTKSVTTTHIYAGHSPNEVE